MERSVVDRAVLHLAAIVASSDDAIVSKDLDGVIQSWNRAAERMFGYEAREAIGQSIRLIIPWDRWPEEDMVLERIRRGEPVEHFETIRLRKDGSLFPISLTVSPIRTADGVIIGASKIARDISDRVRAEELLREAERRQADLQRRLAALLAASGTLLKAARPADVVAPTFTLAHNLVTADAYALWQRDAGTGAWRVVASEGITKGFADGVLPESGMESLTEPLVADDVRRSPLLGSRQVAYEAEGIRSLLVIPLTLRDGAGGTLVFYYRRRHVFTEVEVHTGQALANLAAVALTTSALHDELRRSRDQADRARQRAEFLAHVSGVLAQALDYEETLTRVARLSVPGLADWCAVDVLDESGVLRRLAVEHVDASRIEQARSFHERFPPDPTSPTGVYQVIRTGQPQWIPVVTDEMIAAASKDPDRLGAVMALGIRSFMVVPLIARGRTLGAITFASTTEGRQYGEADVQFVQDVASRAALAMDNARAYEEANRANRAKDEFVTMLSHELRTPLNAVLGWAQMLQRRDLPADQRDKALDVIVRNARAQGQLLAEIFDLAAVVKGKLVLSRADVDLGAVLQGVRDAIAPSASEKRLSLSLELPPERVVVEADADRLHQVFSNLVSNAVKFTPDGGGVTVRLSVRGRFAEVAVADTGEGIAADLLPHVFERFRQADSSMARPHRGLGLGLAIVKELVEAHGGTVSASSGGPGQGSLFLVRLPLT